MTTKETLMIEENSKRTQYYDITNLLSTGASILIPYGERSNGKSGAVKDLILFGKKTKEVSIDGILDNLGKRYFLYVRRWKEDTKYEHASGYFADDFIIEKIEKWSDGLWNRIAYTKGRTFKLAFEDENGKITYGSTVGYAVGVSEAEHLKSNAKYSKCNFVIFEEFLTNKMYLPNEVVDFESILSTVRRKRESDFYVFMIANTVSRVCPYFETWNLHRIFRQKIGTIEIYKRSTIDNDGNEHITKIAVERCANSSEKSKLVLRTSGVDMVNDGAWECSQYPLLYKPLRFFENVYELYFVRGNFKFRLIYLYDSEIEKYLWYCEPKTTELKLQEDDRVVADWYYKDCNWSADFTPLFIFESEIFKELKNYNIVFSDNLTGQEFYQCWNQKAIPMR